MTLKASPLSNRGCEPANTPGRRELKACTLNGCPNNRILSDGAPFQGASYDIQFRGCAFSVPPGYGAETPSASSHAWSNVYIFTLVSCDTHFFVSHPLLRPFTYGLCPCRLTIGFIMITKNTAGSIVGIYLLGEKHGHAATIGHVDIIITIH